jgi:hypothetical protein
MSASQVHPYESTETPDLRIVPLASLVEHEFNDVQRTEPLAKRLEAEGLLKNPPIVAPLEDDPDGRFVVLDGANRTTALHLLGYPHVLVQVVPYSNPPVTLSTWHHLICGIEVQAYLDCIHDLRRLDIFTIDPLHARAGLARRELLAYTIAADGRVFAARTEARSLHEQNDLLNAMVDTYKTRGRLYRAATDNVYEARRLYPDLTGLVIFPNYEAAEVMALARDGELLPTGLTRHLIQGRVLRTNYPLVELRAPDNLDEKNDRLKAWLKFKLGSKEIRLYGEATYLFDE